MKTPRRRIQKARRRAEKRAAALARYTKGRAARLADFDARLRDVPDAVPGAVPGETPYEAIKRIGPAFQRRIVERLRSAGTIVVVVPSRHASTRPCDCDLSDDTKGAMNVHNAATGEGR